MIPTGLGVLIAVTNLCIACLLGVAAGLVGSRLFRLPWGLRAAVLDALLAGVVATLGVFLSLLVPRSAQAHAGAYLLITLIAYTCAVLVRDMIRGVGRGGG